MRARDGARGQATARRPVARFGALAVALVVLGAGLAATASPAAGHGASDAAVPAGTIVEHDLGVHGFGPLAVGADDRVWFGAQGFVGAVEPGGPVDAFPLPTAETPRALARGADGNVWFAFGSSIGRVAPAGAVTTFAAPVPADRLAAGSDGSMWFTSTAGDVLGRITTGGSVSVVADASDGIDDPGALVAGPGGMWVANDGPGALVLVTTDGVVTTVGESGVTASGLAPAVDGVWFVDPDHDVVGRTTLAGVRSTFPVAGLDGDDRVVVGPDGAIWFTDQGGARLGRLTPAGELSWVTSSVIGAPGDVVAGPDGALWSTAPSLGIARTTTAGAATVVPLGPADASFVAAMGDDVWFASEQAVGLLRPDGSRRYVDARPHAYDMDSFVTGADGNVWFINRYLPGPGSSIVRVTTAGDLTEYPVPRSTGHNLVALASGLWYATGTGLARLGYDGSLTEIPTTKEPSWWLGAGPDGNLWYGSTGWPSPPALVRVSEDGAIATFSDPLLVNPVVPSIGPDGMLWITQLDAGPTLRFTAAHTFVPVDGDEEAFRVVTGPDHAAWAIGAACCELHVFGHAGKVELSACQGTSIATTSTSVVVACTSHGTLIEVRAVGAPSAPLRTWAFVGSTTATLTFEAPTFTGSSPVASYRASVAPGGRGCDSLTAPSAAGPGTCSISGLTNGLSYTVTLAAVNADGEGAALTVGPLTPIGPPPAPGSVVAVAGDRSAVVSWGAPVTDGGFPLTGYTVTAVPGGATCTTATGTPSCSVTGLENGTAYTFTVTATNEQGVGLASAASVAVVPHRFGDVPFGAPFFADVEWLADSGIAAGYADGGFHPASPVSRGAMAAFLYRFLGSPAGATPACGGATFSDVPSGSVFCGEIEWLAAHGIASGDAAGTFRPGAAVSRQAMAAFLHRSASLAAASTFVDSCPPPPFTDVGPDSPFCHDVAWAKASGIVNGDPGGTYRPTAPVSRQAMAAFLHRLDPIMAP